MLILDTNIWVAYLNKEDSQHKRAKNVFSRLNEKVIIPEYILVETLNVLATRVNKEKAKVFLKIVFETDHVELLGSSEVFLKEILEFFSSYSYKGLSFVDQTLLFLARTYPVITFDKALAKYL